MPKEKTPEEGDPYPPKRRPGRHSHRRKHKGVRVIVKGYMRPDGSTYHVVIPKQIREQMQLTGGEYFLMSAIPHRDKIFLRKVELAEEDEDA
jgi:hypothetical protein